MYLQNTILYEVQSDGFGERAFSINPNTGEIFQNISFTEDLTRSLRYVVSKLKNYIYAREEG